MLKNKINIILIILSVTFVLPFFKNQLNNLFKVDFSGEGYYFSRQFDLQIPWINTNNFAEIAAESKEDQDSVHYKFRKRPNDRIILRFLFGKPYEQVDQKYKYLRLVEIDTDGASRKRFNYSNLHIGDTTINFTNILSEKTDFGVALKSIAPNEGKFKELAVRRIEVSVLPQEKVFLPNLTLMITTILIPVILFHFLKILDFSKLKSFIFALLSLVAYYALIYYNYYFISHIHLFLLVVICLAYALIAKKKKKGYSLMHIFLFMAVLSIAIHIRWSEVERVSFAPPHGDAYNQGGIGYRQLADNMKLFTKEGFYSAQVGQLHEPFYPLIAKIFFMIFGSSDLHMRFVSFFFAIFAVFLVYLIGCEIFGSRIMALLSSLIIAVNVFLTEQASYGLRLELEMCFLLLLFYFCYLKRNSLQNWIWVLSSGFLGGLWLLTRQFSAPVIIFIFGYSVFRKKNLKFFKKITLFFLMFAISVSLLLPYKINQSRKGGNAFTDTHAYITILANNEFFGEKGFPRKNVSVLEYFFKLHTPLQFVEYHAVGMLGILHFLTEQIFNIINEQNHLLKVFSKQKMDVFRSYPFLTLKTSIIYLFFAFSFLCCLFKQELRILIYVIIIGNLASIFLYGVNIITGNIILQLQRTIAHVLPFVAFCVAYALYGLFTHVLLIKEKAGND